MRSESPWPDLPYQAWRETCSTLHLWMQIIGKIRLARTPWLNHGWHVTLSVTARGLATPPIPHDSQSFEIAFDFIDHALDIRTGEGAVKRIALQPRTVADFYSTVMKTLGELHVPVRINELPCEIPDAIPFTQDRTHKSYDAEYANRFWRVLARVDRVMQHYRTAFIGKCSPVHFFWGSCDLAVTRFSGRRAPLFTGKAPGIAPEVMQEAYSHEVSSAGFWPGGGGTDYAAFYSYAYPVPPDFGSRTVQPASAFFSEKLGEFLLPYDAVRQSPDPEAALMAFLQSTYEAAAETAQWDRAALERPIGKPGLPPATGSASQ